MTTLYTPPAIVVAWQLSTWLSQVDAWKLRDNWLNLYTERHGAAIAVYVRDYHARESLLLCQAEDTAILIPLLEVLKEARERARKPRLVRAKAGAA